MRKLTSLLAIFLLLSCSKNKTLFERLDPSASGIDFINQIEETDVLNVLVYEYFYNGGGVAAADFDNDGLIDLYFSANMGSDKVFKNLGELKFEDKTSGSGIAFNGEWKTGVTVVDINSDGLKDIYVSVSGNEGHPDLRKNKLYINKGEFVFEEKAAEYGLDQDGFTTQSAFFDYDKDGDLDVYIMNHNVKDFKRFDVEAIHFMRDQYAGDRLLRNDDGFFVDVSKEAGIKGNPIGFGLGIHTADLNEDGWTDLYISNDYLEGDYLYINNGDGTFTDNIAEMVDHTSYFSMGNDIADVNNDALPDIFTADMLPEDNKRQKLLFGPDNYEAYLSMLRNGFHPEVMRNMLHVNEGNGKFSEVGQLAGISNTDWSWSPLLADFDNDGLKDMFITNGYFRDYTNNDFVKFYAEQRSEGKDNVLEIINKMPSTRTPNYIFKNMDGLQFENRQKEWGFENKGIGNGAIYADLDNDGDLEIITNNLNEPVGIFENHSNELEGGKSYLKINLNDKPTDRLNTKVILTSNGQKQYREFTPNHGFQSSYDGPVHFGLGSSGAEKIEIIYPDGTYQVITDPEVNTTIEVSKRASGDINIEFLQPYFEEITMPDIVHEQMPINDFSRQILLPWMYSYQGPGMAVGDINGDGLEDFYLGGGKGSPGQLMKALPNGSFVKTNETLLKQWELCTDVDAVFFDADSDGDLDLYVVGGGYEYLPNDLLLQNRLYINDGKGNFTKNDTAFPPHIYSDACVEVFDADGDGDEDLFVGGFVLPGSYPSYNPSRFYLNNGGVFEYQEISGFEQAGLIKDAIATDYNGDGKMDLILAGEWTDLQVFKNVGGSFERDEAAIINDTGIYQSLLAADFDGDGDDDFIVGNLGLNSQLCASPAEPLELYTADFDGNGRKDPILSCYLQGKAYPFYSRDEMLDQLFPLRKAYNSYELYSEATTADILKNFPEVTPEIQKATTLETVYFKNEGGRFVRQSLPVQIQAAPVYALLSADIDQDGDLDLIAGGNNTKTRVRLGNISANHGQVFLNDGKGNFTYVPQCRSGLNLIGDVRGLEIVNNNLIVGRNTLPVLFYSLGR
ncbi:VCBS repeat-containing protein [Jiulongibacter sediminis]|uniref:VCBS repeat-containing protein n=1 Tax=Jiulongibacter sediminis TaxID=1605367 RepID=UPI0006DCA744|nr:VCBS repeat-containing protein [Jiulongibacter sediminis]